MYDDLVAGINADNLLINYQILQINRMMYESNLKHNIKVIKLLEEIRDNGTKRDIQ